VPKFRSDPVVDCTTTVHWLRPTEAVPGLGSDSLKVIVELGVAHNILNLIMPNGASVTAYGDGTLAVFTDPDDENGEAPALIVRPDRSTAAGWLDNSDLAAHQ
jgi:hypothetical protein